MKSKKLNTFLIFFCLFTFTFSHLLAQEIKKNNEKTPETSKVEKPIETQDVEGDVVFKDGDNNQLMRITDEGTSASIQFKDGVPALTSNKLYRNGDSLFYGNTNLSRTGSNSKIDSLDQLSDAKTDATSIFLGFESGINDDGTANQNTAIGKHSMKLNTSGYMNTAVGYKTLEKNTTGAYNLALGNIVLANNIDGHNNIACGHSAMFHNSTGDLNIALGTSSLANNISGNSNISIGINALFYNLTTSNNVAIGFNALFSNIANGNTATGFRAMIDNTSGSGNTANGYNSLESNIEGEGNTAIGNAALNSNVNGNFNTAIGYSSGPSHITPDLNNTTAIGYSAIPTSSNNIVIGNTAITSIQGQVAMSLLSDGRFKKNIKENISGLDFIMGLRPVSYTMDYNLIAEKLGENNNIVKTKENETYGIVSSKSTKAEIKIIEARNKKSEMRQTGFIAQEVEVLVNKLGIDFSGVEIPENEKSMYRLRYTEFIVPLVKAVQEQEEVIQNLIKRIEDLEKTR
ncbi:MAG: tail fiber domain-containing protein [Ignavibacteriae bacterium]|nr:tail fiber domain-containing protein [Ignavibacteriota bacterium]